MAACREGHDSASDDFCDVCGTRIGGSPAGPGRRTGEQHGLGPRAANGGEPCPSCGVPASGPVCGVCGIALRARRPFAPIVQPVALEEPGSLADSRVTELLASLFSPAPPQHPEPSSSAALPPAVMFEPAPAATAPPEPPSASVRSEPPAVTLSQAFSAPPATPTPSFAPATWTVLVSSDRNYYDRMRGALGRSGPDVLFPAHVPERRIPLIGKQMRIGRRSAARELEPEIDLAEPPVDPGISRLHAMLIAASDGTWSVLDPGSANGTQLNGGEIATGDLVALREGDRINLGAWTVISMHRG
jgi:hypothetical protein